MVSALRSFSNACGLLRRGREHSASKLTGYAGHRDGAVT